MRPRTIGPGAEVQECRVQQCRSQGIQEQEWNFNRENANKKQVKRKSRRLAVRWGDSDRARGIGRSCKLECLADIAFLLDPAESAISATSTNCTLDARSRTPSMSKGCPHLLSSACAARSGATHRPPPATQQTIRHTRMKGPRGKKKSTQNNKRIVCSCIPRVSSFPPFPGYPVLFFNVRVIFLFMAPDEPCTETAPTSPSELE